MLDIAQGSNLELASVSQIACNSFPTDIEHAAISIQPVIHITVVFKIGT